VRQQVDNNRHFAIDEHGAREERARAGAVVADLEAVLRARGVIETA
jgi:hypothetical protein